MNRQEHLIVSVTLTGLSPELTQAVAAQSVHADRTNGKLG